MNANQKVSIQVNRSLRLTHSPWNSRCGRIQCCEAGNSSILSPHYRSYTNKKMNKSNINYQLIIDEMFNYINCFYFRCVIVHSVYKKCDILEFCIVQLKTDRGKKCGKEYYKIRSTPSYQNWLTYCDFFNKFRNWIAVALDESFVTFLLFQVVKNRPANFRFISFFAIKVYRFYYTKNLIKRKENTNVACRRSISTITLEGCT